MFLTMHVQARLPPGFDMIKGKAAQTSAFLSKVQDIAQFFYESYASSNACLYVSQENNGEASSTYSQKGGKVRSLVKCTSCQSTENQLPGPKQRPHLQLRGERPMPWELTAPSEPEYFSGSPHQGQTAFGPALVPVIPQPPFSFPFCYSSSLIISSQRTRNNRLIFGLSGRNLNCLSFCYPSTMWYCV